MESIKLKSLLGASIKRVIEIDPPPENGYTQARVLLEFDSCKAIELVQETSIFDGTEEAQTVLLDSLKEIKLGGRRSRTVYESATSAELRSPIIGFFLPYESTCRMGVQLENGSFLWEAFGLFDSGAQLAN